MNRRHVALIRGINVGRAKRVAMADLKSLMEELGYGDVRTLLNSGNVVFSIASSDRRNPAPRIEEGMTSRLGIPARVTVLTADELDAVVAENPLGKVANDPTRLLVTVLTDPASRKDLLPLTRQKWAPEAFALGKRAAYVWCPKSMLESPLFAAVTKLVGSGATTRNWATVMKIHAVAAGR